MYRPGSTLQHFKSISSNIVTQGAASPKYKLNVVDAMDHSIEESEMTHNLL